MNHLSGIRVRLAAPVAIALFFAGTLNSQTRDFLNTPEVEQIREAQDPNDRLALYAKFAKMRIDIVMQVLQKQKAGRSLLIHDTLEDYSHIIEAIDSVADDALRRKLPIDKGMLVVIAAEKDFSDRLGKIEDTNPPDLSRYDFVLKQALDTTNDSLELSMEDSHKRQADVLAADQKEKKERESNMADKEVADRKKQDSAAAADADKAKKKIPSLYKPGEKPPDQ